MSSDDTGSDGNECPSCGEVGHIDGRMVERTDQRLPVAIYLCDNIDCRVREFFRTLDTETERSETNE